MQKIIFYLTVLIIFALPSYLVRFNVFGIPTTLLEVLIYLSFLLTIISFIGEKRKTKSVKQQIKIKSIIHNSLFIIPIILFMIAGIIGVMVSPDKNVALGQFKAYIIDPILFFWIIVVNFQFPISNRITNYELRITNFKPIFQALILGGTLVAIHAIYQKLIGDLTPDARVVGIFGYSPNYLALFLTPIAVLTMGYEMLVVGNQWKDPRNVKKILPYDLAFSIIIIAIFFSGSRAGLGVTIISISLLLILRWWKWILQKNIVSIFLCLCVILLLAGGWWFIKPNWQLSPEVGGRITSSNNIRWEIWQTSGKILATENNWLWGVGLGNYQNYFSNFTKGWTNYDEYISPNALTAHSLYLQIWFNMGLLGIISFIWLIYLVIRNSIFVIRNSKNPDSSYKLQVTNLLLVVMLSILFYGFVDTPYWKNDLSVVFWVILALTMINNNKQEIKT